MSLLIPGLLAATAEILQESDVPVGALAIDEECAVGADGSAPRCALNALQRNAQKATAGGEEVVAEVKAANTTAAQASESNAVEEPEAFVELEDADAEEPEDADAAEPEDADAEEPEAFVELEESEDDRQEKESTEEQDSTKDEWGSRRRFSSKNKCCKCKDNTVSWSQSGTCSHCRHSGIFIKKSPPLECQYGSSQWRRGNSNWPPKTSRPPKRSVKTSAAAAWRQPETMRHPSRPARRSSKPSPKP